MPNHRKKLPEDEIVRLYQSGESTMAEIQQRYGCSEGPIYRLLRDAGVRLDRRERVGHQRRRPMPMDEIRRLYIVERLSEKEVADRLGVSRTVIRARLLDMGIEPRSYAGAQNIIWGRRTHEQRMAHLVAPHAATLGRKPTIAERLLNARTREERATHTSTKEVELAAALRAHGLSPVPQRAIGPYNCDMAVGPVAVEVWGGHWHFTGHHRATCEERFRYILRAGWCIYVLPVTKPDPMTDTRVRDLVTYIEETSRNPAMPREYRVVWSAGQWERVGTLDDDHFTIDPPFTYGERAPARRHQRIPQNA